jgi:hypothetical protein
MALPAGTARAAYSTTLVAGGGTPPYVWTLVSSSPQSWLSLSATGEITGTPTAAVAVLFTAKVTDGASASVSKDFLVVIADPNSPVAITTDGTLPPGTVGLAYSEALVATGDTPPYVWSLSSGVLPAGLSLSSAGVISGTPTAAETDRFTIQVAARGVVSSSLPFSLTISAPVPDQSGVFAHLVSGGGWKTSLYLINASVSTVPVVVKFRDDTGSALSLPLTTTLAGGTQTANAPSVSETIAPGATLLIESDSQASVSVTGWAEVISAGPLTGYGVFHYTSSAGVESEGTVPSESSFSPSFILPYDGLSGYTAGVALTNPVLSQAATITTTIWDENGSQIGAGTVDVPAGGHTSFLLFDKFPIASTNRGIVEFRTVSKTNITGFGLRIRTSGGLTLIPKLQRP